MIVLETLLRRWYVVAFVVAFFWAASSERGWKRALRFLAVAGSVALVAEMVSTRAGFPYGRYSYLAPTQSDEIWVAGIPLFVPIGFAVVVWAGRSLAIAGFGAREQGAVILGGAACATLLDFVADPVTLRGGRWFLGLLYEYESHTGWFGVPWSNFGGWLLVSAAILWLDELLEVNERQTVDPIRGPTLAFAVVAFHVLVALFTTLFVLALIGTGIGIALFFLTRARIAALLAEAAGPEEASAPG